MVKRRKKSETSLETLAQRELNRVLREAARITALRKLAISELAWDGGVKIVSAAEMTKLNAKYRGKRKPTDVLSFSAPEVFRQAGHLGEIVICLPVLRAQAVEQKHSEAAELRVLIVHGVLHLLGLDHEKGTKEAAEMARYEKRLLKTKSSRTARGLIGRAR